MARRARNYKAEYARSKARARSAGYASEREYKAVRKSLKLPPRTSPVPRRVLDLESPGAVSRARVDARRIGRIRRENKRWSDRSSKVPGSKYRPTFTDEQAERYHAAFVDRIEQRTKKGRREKFRRLHDFLVPDFLSEAEWEQDYPT